MGLPSPMGPPCPPHGTTSLPSTRRSGISISMSIGCLSPFLAPHPYRTPISITPQDSSAPPAPHGTYPEGAAGGVDAAPGDDDGVLDGLGGHVHTVVGAVTVVLHLDVDGEALSVLRASGEVRGPIGTQWCPMGPTGTQQDPMSSNGSQQDPTSPSGTQWLLIGLNDIQ